MPALSPKKPLNSQEAKLVKYLSSVKEEDIFPEKNKKAVENLLKAGLIKEDQLPEWFTRP
jgi:hypothetical protein